MEIRITYIGTLNGVHGIWCGFKPEGAEITEERLVLYPANGFTLVNKETGEEAPAVWIKTEDGKDDWVEVKIKEPEDE